MKLYEFGPSRAIRVRWVLQELEVPFESVSVNLSTGANRGPEFLKLNPAGKLPVLVDGDQVLTESAAIAIHLAEKYPDKRLIPADPAGRAEFFRWVFFTVTELEQPLWRITKQTSLYPEGKRIPADIDLARGDFAAMAQVMEDHMQGRDFVAGDHVTVADFLLAYTLDWAKAVKLLNGYPALNAYMDRMYARPHAPRHIRDIVIELRRQAAAG